MDDPLHILPFLVVASFLAVIILTAILLHLFEGWLETKHPALPWILYAAEFLAFALIFFGTFIFSSDLRTILLIFLGIILVLTPLVLLCLACCVLDKRRNAPNWLKSVSLIYVISFFPLLFIFLLVLDILAK